MLLTCSGSNGCWTMRAWVRCLWRPGRIRGRMGWGSGFMPCSGRPAAICCGSWEPVEGFGCFGFATKLLKLKDVDAVRGANLEPVVVKVVAHESVADFHEDMLSAYL